MDVEDYSREVEMRLFFLGPSIVDPLEGAGSDVWTLRWDVSKADHVWAFGRGSKYLLNGFTPAQDGTLVMERVQDAVIRTKNRQLKKEMTKEIGKIEQAKRGPLRAVCPASKK